MATFLDSYRLATIEIAESPTNFEVQKKNLKAFKLSAKVATYEDCCGNKNKNQDKIRRYRFYFGSFLVQLFVFLDTSLPFIQVWPPEPISFLPRLVSLADFSICDFVSASVQLETFVLLKKRGHAMTFQDRPILRLFKHGLAPGSTARYNFVSN